MATIEQISMRKEALKRKHLMICEDFKKMREQYPSATLTAVLETLVDRYAKENVVLMGMPITSQQLRNIVVKYGYYTPRKRKRK